jgi:hypothetical protein
MVVEDQAKEVENDKAVRVKASEATRVASAKKSTCMILPVVGGGFTSSVGYQRPKSKFCYV